MDIDSILKKIASLASHEDSGGALQRICDHLREAVAHYDWVGYYLALPRERVLLLGPFSGEPTEHTRIPYGKGICGQAAERDDVFVVPDVSSQSNYLACSVATRAEIVLPVRHGGEFVGELDIDSHTRDPFSPADDRLLSEVVKITAPLVSSILAHVRRS